MRDHITLVMHRQFMSMSERDIASASARNTTPEHPDPQSLIPSNLLDSLPERSPPPPSHTYGLPPSVTKKTYSTSSNPDPQTPPCLGSQRPPSPPPLSRLLNLSRRQQWLYCTPEQADIWKPRKNELENLNKKLNKKLKKHVRLASLHDANGEEDLDSKQKKCQQNKQQTPLSHPPPSPPPKSSSPTRQIPHHDTENGHSDPALQHLDHKLLETQTQRHTEDTHCAHAHKASENMKCKPAKKEM